MPAKLAVVPRKLGPVPLRLIEMRSVLDRRTGKRSVTEVLLACGHVTYSRAKYKARCKKCAKLLAGGMVPWGFVQGLDLQVLKWVPTAEAEALSAALKRGK
jgi:hypothetical protein